MLVTSHKLPADKTSLGWHIIIGKADPRDVDRMLLSIKPTADQIVIYLDERADPSVYEVCSRYTSEIYYHHNPSRDFAAQRNRALGKLDTYYGAWIDHDEWIGGRDAARILNLMTKPLGLAYYVWQVSPCIGDVTLYVPQIRIFPNLPGLRWEIPIHEQILPSLQRLGVKTQVTDLRIEHGGYTDPKVVYEKHRRNMRLLRRRLRENPGDAFTRSNYEKAKAFEKWYKVTYRRKTA